MEVNSIYCGDCKDILKKFPSKSVDLIYADPPFYTDRHWEIIWKDGAEIRAFGDRWKGGINHYVGWLIERIEQCHRVLKPTGSMYLHCDWHAGHYLKVAMDKIFGLDNFVNQIVWKRQIGAHSDTKQGAKHFGRGYDTILFYKMGKKYTFNTQFTPYDKTYLDSFYVYVEFPDGRLYRISDSEKGILKELGGKKELVDPHFEKHGKRLRLDNLTASKPGGDTSYEWKGVKPYKGRYWAYSKMKMTEFDKKGRIYYSPRTGFPQYKRYLNEMPGVPLQDLWTDISPITSRAKERLGYPTQKPIALLERIISVSSNKGDIVLDPFCGCGTTLLAAHKLERKYIGIDVSRTACKLMERRIRSEHASPTMIYGELTEKQLKKFPPFEFQNWVCEKLGGRIHHRKTGDMGIDGWTLDMTPIQVKQSEKVGRNPIDNFQTAIRRAGKKAGIFVAFSFGSGAYEEIARAKNDGIEINAITVEELLKKK